MKRVLILPTVILLFAATGFAQTKISPPAVAASPEKQRAAEQVVIRTIRRFGQTLDFEPVYREMFVKDKTLWRNYFDSYLDPESDIKEFRNASSKTFKTLTAKMNNIFWLLMFSGMDDEQIDKFLENKIVPKLSKSQQIIYNKIVKSNENVKEDEAVNSKLDIREILSMCDVALAVIRKNFAQTIQRNAGNKVTINSVQLINHSSKQSIGKRKEFCEITININGEEMNILFTVAEENGRMKIVSIEGIND